MASVKTMAFADHMYGPLRPEITRPSHSSLPDRFEE